MWSLGCFLVFDVIFNWYPNFLQILIDYNRRHWNRRENIALFSSYWWYLTAWSVSIYLTVQSPRRQHTTADICLTSSPPSTVTNAPLVHLPCLYSASTSSSPSSSTSNMSLPQVVTILYLLILVSDVSNKSSILSLKLVSLSPASALCFNENVCTGLHKKNTY